MRAVLFFFFLIVNNICFGQNSILFDKVIFKYSKGHSSWGHPGVYSKEEVFEFYPAGSEAYRIKKYLKITFTAGKDSGSFSKDTIVASAKTYLSAIPRVNINALYRDLTTTKDNFNPAFIRPRLKPSSKKEILDIAKSNGLGYKFEDMEMPGMQNIIKKIKNFDMLDTFINRNRPNPDLVTITTDVWDGLEVYFIKNPNTIVFRQGFRQLLGQPILMLRINKLLEDKQFVNLDANLLLEQILPKSSTLRKRVGINCLTKEYIKWYIKEKI